MSERDDTLEWIRSLPPEYQRAVSFSTGLSFGLALGLPISLAALVGAPSTALWVVVAAQTILLLASAVLAGFLHAALRRTGK